MLRTHLFSLCENTSGDVGKHAPAATSPVSRSLIKQTEAGPWGQAQISGPSPCCHTMMDRCGAGCQAATHIHCPVGVHQKTLAKHPVDLICI